MSHDPQFLRIELKLYMQRVEGVTMIVNWWMGYSVMDITQYKLEVNAKFTSNTFCEAMLMRQWICY